MLVLAAPCASLHAEFIQPVAVLVSNGVDPQDALINGSGFDVPGIGDPDSVHNRVASEMWSGIGSIRESAIFDLGTNVSLTKVYIWNYNVQDATDVGMKDVEVQVSSDPDIAGTNLSFNAIAKISLQEGGEKAQAFDVVGTTVRLVKLKGLSNWGQGYTVGLAEVRFASGDITGNVPTVVVNSPREGDEVALGNDITIDAKVTDKDGAANILKVEFFDGDTLLTNKTATPFTYVLKGAAKGPHALRVVATDKTAKVAWSTVNISVRELVSDRILKIDDTADEGSNLNQITYVGTWNLAQGGTSDPRYLNNDHYESNNNKNDYFLVRFKGVKIDVFATVASHHGTGMASIDGGAETKVNYKAAQRGEQVLVWSSPILANREHVLKIRVFGDGVVTADRFDVSVSDKPDVTTAIVKEVAATFTNLIVRMEDVGASVVAPASVKLILDGATAATPPPFKAGVTTTIIHTPATPFLPGSTHALRVEAMDTAGTGITNESTFTLPAPFFPLSGLGGPASTAGNWGLRQIWNAGRADAVVSAVDIALQANQPGFTGTLQDTQVPFINLALTANPGGGALFADHLPLPAEADGLSTNDFVLVARAKVVIPRSGDWTIGVHTDDGFALRFMGAPFESVSGNGVRNDDFPECIAFPNPGNSNMRGVLTNLAAGEYDIEFIAYQRTGGSYYEVYAAEGAFVDDAETDQWQPIGAPGGLQVIAGPRIPLTIRAIAKAFDHVTIDFDTPSPVGSHDLLESGDLKSWQPAASAAFEKQGGNRLRATLQVGPGSGKFYRIILK